MMSTKAIAVSWLITAILVLIVFLSILFFLRNSQLPFVDQVKGIINDLKEPAFFAKKAMPEDVLKQQNSNMNLPENILDSEGL